MRVPVAQALRTYSGGRAGDGRMSTTDLVRADLLASLEESGWLSSTALVIDRPDLSYEKYTALGVLIGKVGTAVKWWVGDYLMFGEALYGERAAQASEALNLSAEGRQECLRVALAVPRSRRRPSLSWWHHRIVAARWLTLPQREQLLDEAEREGLTTRELEARVRDLRALDSDSRGATAGLPRPPRPGRGVAARAARRVRLPRRLGGRDRGRGRAGDHRRHKDGRVSATLSPADLARRVRLQCLRIDRGTAEMFLAWWLMTGLVEEVLPGQFRLTREGHRVAGGLLAARDGEAA